MGQRFGRYELLHPLGRGGMAEVFLARYSGPEGFEKRLVIKRVLPELATSRRFLQLFFDEARTHVSLSHGNLVPVFDFGRVGNAYFIAMEHVPGRDLATLLEAARARGERLPERLTAYVGEELCRGLAYVHRRGLVHRDVAPRNVLLSLEGEVKLSDFGVALSPGGEAPTGVRGTVAYMAPEQARGERVDGRADLYALGMVLAEALLGRRVRPSAEPEQALALARSAAAVEVAGPLGRVIARATAPDPAQRFADADELLRALQAVSAQLGDGASAARELAGRLTALCGAETPAGDTEAAPPPDAGPRTLTEETYFRDRKSDATFAEEVLPPRPAGRPVGAPRTLALFGAGGAILAVAVAAALVFAARRPAVTAPARPMEPPVTAQPLEPTRPSKGEPARPPPPLRPAAARRPPAVTPPPPASALVIRCTPWCEPIVDGETRGADGRRHALAVPAGRHRVSVKRLDDRQERAVELRAGETQTLDFTFE